MGLDGQRGGRRDPAYASLDAFDFVPRLRAVFGFAGAVDSVSPELSEEGDSVAGSDGMGGAGSVSREASVSPETAGAAASGAYGGGVSA